MELWSLEIAKFLGDFTYLNGPTEINLDPVPKIRISRCIKSAQLIINEVGRYVTPSIIVVGLDWPPRLCD